MSTEMPDDFAEAAQDDAPPVQSPTPQSPGSDSPQIKLTPAAEEDNRKELLEKLRGIKKVS